MRDYGGFMRTRSFFFFSLLFITFSLVGCKSKDARLTVAGKFFTYEKEGFGSDFQIHFLEDGKFVYYEGILSSYIGMGSWKIDGNVLIMIDGDDISDAEPYFKNKFIVKENRIIWQAEGSTNFLYLHLSNGDAFWESEASNSFPFAE